MVMFETEIKKISEIMKERLIEKQDTHGNSWKESDLNVLLHRVHHIYEIFLDRIPSNEFLMKLSLGEKVHKKTLDNYKQGLLDLANQCMLLYLRLDDIN